MTMSKSLLAGVLDIVSGLHGLIGGGVLLLLGIAGSGIIASIPEDVPTMIMILPGLIFFPLALLFLVSGAVATFGGLAAIQKRNWGMALAGGIASVIAFFPVGLFAVLFTVLAEEEFAGS